MQSSMWKLLTAAGIIGIGTMTVLEVQNRLSMLSHASNIAKATNSAEIAGATPSGKSDVIPDATTALDRMLAGDNAIDDTQFAMDEPNAPHDTGSLHPTADDQVYAGVTPVNRTVLKDTLASDDNSLDRSFESDSEPKPSSTSGAAEPQANSATTTEPVSFSGETAPVASSTLSSPSKSIGTSSTMFFNGNHENTTSATTSKSATPSVAAPPTTTRNMIPTSTPTLTPASSDSRTAAVDSSAARSTSSAQQIDPDVPDLFMPDAVPEIDRPSSPSAPRSQPALDTPLMETPGFESDTVPNFDITPELANPAGRDGSGVPPESNPSTPGGTPAASTNDDDTRFFESDEPVPTPPVGNGGSRPDTSRQAPPAFDLDPVPGLDDRSIPPRSTPRSTPGSAPHSTPPNPADADFPKPSYPDPGSVPDLNEGAPFDSLPGRGDAFEDSSNLPAISDRPARSTPDRSGGGPGAAGDAGDRRMSEVMRPQLSIEKHAPGAATVGVPHEYTIVVSNEGDSTAYDVVVDDELGNGAKLENSKPTADFDRASGRLSWTIRELAPHDKQEIVVRVTPTGEGTLDGIATVRFKAQVKSATIITAPKLTLEMTGPNEVKVGDEVQLRYVISNKGTGDASNVILRSMLPPGLKHSEGGDLEYEIENLRAGDREEINLTVVAAEPGRLRTVSEVTTSGVSAAKATTDIDIIGSQLTIQRLGPERRFVGRTAKFQNVVTNETNFEANNAIVTELVPEGMKFISADNGGEYNPETGRIRWELARLAPGRQTVLEVELEAVSAGEREMIVEVVENAGFRSQATENTVVTVEDYENMTANISRQDAPVAIGETFGFTITIENRGTAVARNVEMVIDVPSEIVVKAAGTRTIPARRMGNSVRYSIVEAIQPAEKMTFELKLQGERPAQNALVRASLKYEQMKEPLIVSESVTIFDDRP